MVVVALEGDGVVLESWSWWGWLGPRPDFHTPVLDDLEGLLWWGVVSWEERLMLGVGLEAGRVGR